MTFTFIPKGNVLGAISLPNPYGESPPVPDYPPRGLVPGEIIELYVPTIGGDREPWLEHWDRYRVEEVSASDAVTLIALEESPRILACFTLGITLGADMPREFFDGESGETWRLIHREGRAPAYQSDRGHVMRKTLDKALKEGVDWRRVTTNQKENHGHNAAA